ncbi:MAG: hypothetical protein GY820_35090 [Gammaproteobacteria bacterium]|nr:hypothetical protein [Pseudoalteromonas sp.]MCP4492496.1 hypothetical protein [Gammaproteobacteria bacterium]
MKVIKPVSISEGMILSSTIAEPDAGETVWSPYTAAIGDRRINVTTHRVYECAVATTDDPTVGVTKTPQSWVDVGPTNKFAMFDLVNSTTSIEQGDLTLQFSPSQVLTSLAAFSVNGASDVIINMTNAGLNVYSKTIEMNDNGAVDSIWHYFFEPQIRSESFVINDLPAHPTGVLEIEFKGSSVNVGNIVIGNQIDIGSMAAGTSLQLLDYSRKETDSFGNTVVQQGRTSKLVNFNLAVDYSLSSYVFNQVASMTGSPSVWFGDAGDSDPTLVFGYYRDLNINLTTNSVVDATITIEGLV